jgi:adenylate cyclase
VRRIAAGDDLLRYLPRYLGEPAWQAAAGARLPRAVATTGTVLVLDFMGFGTLSRELAALGPRGAEELSQLLSASFGGLTEAVLDAGGDIVVFAGDSLLALWPDETGTPALHRALAAAFAAPPGTGGQLRARRSVAQGEVLRLALGRDQGQRLHLVAGAAVTAAVRLNGRGSDDAVVVDEPLIAALGPGFAIEPLVAGGALVRPQGPALPDAGAFHGPDREACAPRLASGSWAFEDDLLPAVRCAPRAGAAGWAGEFREVSVLSARLVTAPSADPPQLERLNAEVLALQDAVEAHGGTTDHLGIEDKGLVFHALFGLPPQGQVDAALRAVEAARAALRSTEAAGAPIACGISSGRLYVGDYGGPRRRTVSSLGWEVTLAARLMQATDAGILCDRRTIERAGPRLAPGEPLAVRIKSALRPVEAFRVAADAASAPGTALRPVVGRRHELETLRARIDALPTAPPAIVVLTGPPGVGKSRLARAAAEHATTNGWQVVRLEAGLLDRSATFQTAARLVATLLGGPQDATGDGLATALATALADRPALLPMLPLLGDVLPLRPAPDAHPPSLTGEGRQRVLEELLAAVLAHGLGNGPAVLVLDDLHLADPASLRVLERLLDRPGRLLLATVRDSDATPSPELSAWLDRAGASIEPLAGLDASAIAALLAEVLQVERVGPALTELVAGRSEGIPLFAEELALALDAALLIARADGRADLAADLDDEAIDAIPPTLGDVIVSRIDRLTAAAQLVLRAAAASGDVVPPALLRGLPSLADVASGLEETIAALVAARFLVPHETAEGAPGLAFRHATLRAVVYDQALFAQRRVLHAEIARWLEGGALGTGDDRLAPRLAWHWERAEHHARACAELARAASRSLRLYALADAARQIERAFALAGQHGVAVSATERRRWEMLRADAHHELFEYDRARRGFHRALALDGVPPPATPLGVALASLRETGAQLVRRLADPIWRRAPAGETRRLALVGRAHAHQRLAEAAYFANDAARTLYHTLASLNLAERAGDAEGTVVGYASLSVGLGSVGLDRLAASYDQRSMRLAAAQGAEAVLAYAHLVHMVFMSARGGWREVEASAAVAAPLWQRIGAVVRWQQTRAVRCFAAFHEGDRAAALHELAAVEATLERATPLQVRAWVVAARLILADDPDAEAALDTAAALTREAGLHSAERVLLCGLLAQALWQRRDLETARAWARQGLAEARRHPPTPWHLTDGMAGIADTLLALAGSAKPASHDEATAAVHALAGYARRVPVARARAELARARLAAILGQGRREARCVRRAAGLASRYRLGRETAMMQAGGVVSAAGADREVGR